MPASEVNDLMLESLKEFEATGNRRNCRPPGRSAVARKPASDKTSRVASTLHRSGSFDIDTRRTRDEYVDPEEKIGRSPAKMARCR
jgi:hypothetical protein